MSKKGSSRMKRTTRLDKEARSLSSILVAGSATVTSALCRLSRLVNVKEIYRASKHLEVLRPITEEVYISSASF